jgi:hypothetical protein
LCLVTLVNVYMAYLGSMDSPLLFCEFKCNCIDVHTITIKKIKKIIRLHIYNNLNEKELVIECLSR